MTTFPERIEISLINRNNNNPIEKVIGLVTLFANHKNNYSIYTPLSDKDGSIIITKGWLEKQMYLEASTAIMDYSSNLQDCKPYVEFNIVSNDRINIAIESLKVWATIVTDYQTDLNNLLLARNQEYSPCTEMVQINQHVLTQKVIVYLQDK